MHKFNKKKDKLLIELVEKNPVLYDPDNANFKNCVAKHTVWEYISSVMGIAVPDLKRRWKHFRDHFHKNQKAENVGLTTVHTWDFMPYLSFLIQFSNHTDLVKDNSEDLIEKEIIKGDFIMEESVGEVTVGFEGARAEASDDVPLEINDRAETEIFIPEQVQFDLIDHEEVLEWEPDPEVILRKKRRHINTLAVLEGRLAERYRYQTWEIGTSPIHKFFESMADIVAEFPPHLVAETRLKVCQLVNEIEAKKIASRSTY